MYILDLKYISTQSSCISNVILPQIINGLCIGKCGFKSLKSLTLKTYKFKIRILSHMYSYFSHSNIVFPPPVFRVPSVIICSLTGDLLTIYLGWVIWQQIILILSSENVFIFPSFLRYIEICSGLKFFPFSP